jgi:hypothetical protein
VYDVVWTSEELHEEVTDIRLGDTNLNNRTEIIAAAIKGYLYAYEWLPTVSEIVSPLSSLPQAGGLLASGPERLQSLPIAIGGEVEREQNLEAYSIDLRRIEA